MDEDFDIESQKVLLEGFMKVANPGGEPEIAGGNQVCLLNRCRV